MIELTNTNSREISSQLSKRHRAMGPASGMVFTLIVVADREKSPEVFDAAMDAGREHPSRIILVMKGEDGETKVDARIHQGQAVPGDIIELSFCGELIDNADSVIVPLLLPDSPVVVWWPHNAPADLASDPIGALATRNVTDVAGCQDPVQALLDRAANHASGDTDLSWTRITLWRGLVASALDQYPCTPTSVRVRSESNNASAVLLATWLRLRLGVDTTLEESDGPGLTDVHLETCNGTVSISRLNGTTASYLIPGQVDRQVALKRRPLAQLITEDLRRMGPDATFDAVLASLHAEHERNR